MGSQTSEFPDPHPWHACKVKTLGAWLDAVRNPKACISKGAIVQTPPWGSEPHQQPFTTQPEEWALEAPLALEPKVSSGLFQVSPPHLSGKLRRCHLFIMPHPVCNYVHRIVLRFYVYFLHIYPSYVSYFFPVSTLVWVVQSYHGWVCLRYLRLIWDPLVIFLLGVQCYQMTAHQKS
jgi:hypothetical protein